MIKMIVNDVMRTDLECVKPGDLVTHARSLIRDKGLRILPVCDGQKLVGILSRGDVLKVTSTKTNLTIGGVMQTNVVTAAPEDDLLTASRRLAQYRILYMPVVEDGRLVGMVSSREVLKHLMESKSPPKQPLSEVMTTDVVTCSPDDELSTIWDKLTKTGLGGLPVVDKKAVVGMITKLDLLRHGSARLVKGAGKSRKLKVSKVMKARPITINVRKTVKDAVYLMVSNKITKLPVVDDKNNLVGIVGVEDVYKAYVS